MKITTLISIVVLALATTVTAGKTGRKATCWLMLFGCDRSHDTLIGQPHPHSHRKRVAGYNKAGRGGAAVALEGRGCRR